MLKAYMLRMMEMLQNKILNTKRRNEGYQLFLIMNIPLTIVSIYSNAIKPGVGP